MSNPAGGKPPPLKLKLKTTSSGLAGPVANSITAAPTVATPSAMSPPSATPKTAKKIVLKRSLPPTPAGEGVPILPAPPGTSRVPLPSGVPNAPAQNAKKRGKPHGDRDDDGPASAQAKRVKIVATPKGRNLSLVVKPSHQARLPTHPRGQGYDSEDEDREVDPVIEEQFILRMLPGDHCDALRKLVEERKIGLDSQFRLKWLKHVERRAAITISGAVFAAVLVDLPTISEGMKSWDRKTFVKSADICQMLLVFARVPKEEEAATVPLPKMVNADYRWPHGLTPPMHDCIHRRFRKRLSKKEIKDKEAELQRILKADKEAVETSWELIDDAREGMRKDDAMMVDDDEGDVGDDEQDAIGEEEEYFGVGAMDGFAQEIDEDELAAQFMEAEADAAADAEMAETPASQPVTTPAPFETTTPAADADEEDESEEEDDEEELDEEAQARAAYVKGVMEDIVALEKQNATAIHQISGVKNPILKSRAQARIKQIEEEIRLKKASIGITED